MLQNTPTPQKLQRTKSLTPQLGVYDGPNSNLWVSSYQNPQSNLLCGGGAT